MPGQAEAEQHKASGPHHSAIRRGDIPPHHPYCRARYCNFEKTDLKHNASQISMLARSVACLSTMPCTAGLKLNFNVSTTEAQYQGIMQVAEAFTLLERQAPYRKFRVAASGRLCARRTKMPLFSLF